jgi:N-acetylneuraminate synthase/N,N'-diacetyllegionaminate synthase
MKPIKIGNKLIGEKQPCFIIAEAGVNHNGKLELAKKLINAAVDAGVDAVKFQAFKPEGVATKTADVADYIEKNIRKEMTQIALLKNLALKYGEFKVLKKYCDDKNIIFLATPHSFDAIDFLEDLVPAYKFGSGDITNIPSLKYAAKKKKPIILGTGMSTLQEVKDAVDAIKSEYNDQIIALHCTTNYPCTLDEVNLRAMITMQKELDCLVGYSDHTLGMIVPVMAVALGAVVLEKHVTIDKNLPGPDHKTSLEPHELKKMVAEVRNAETVMGSFEKRPTDSEQKIMKLVRKSIVANQNIRKGSIIARDMLIFKRPGTGVKPADLKRILGKKTKRNIAKDEIFKLNMVE